MSNLIKENRQLRTRCQKLEQRLADSELENREDRQRFDGVLDRLKSRIGETEEENALLRMEIFVLKSQIREMRE